MISVVIPVWNEAKALPETLRTVSQQEGDFEIIVADGGSTDSTREIAARFPRVRLTSAPKGRASQMNAGAGVARGDWLLFLHADTVLPEGAIVRLNAASPVEDYEAGAFHQRFTGAHWMLRLVSWLHNTRCRLTGIFYGDQAIFVRRDLFVRLGGYPTVPILEDVLFSEKLKKATRPVLLDERVLTDSRKFEQHGIVRSCARVLVILLCHELRLPVRARRFFEDVR